MPRTALPKPEQVPADSKPTLDMFTKNIGFTPNMMATFALSPIAFNSWATIAHSPFMSWLHALFGIRGASYVIGVLELSTASALIVGATKPLFSALGAAMSTMTYLVTLTF